jgi:hypothetical protein
LEEEKQGSAAELLGFSTGLGELCGGGEREVPVAASSGARERKGGESTGEGEDRDEGAAVGGLIHPENSGAAAGISTFGSTTGRAPPSCLRR